MTKNKDFKNLVRERMRTTGENFTSARAALLGDTTPSGPETTLSRKNAVPAPAESKAEAFRAKTLKTFMPTGEMVSIPTKRKALVVILLDILTAFEAERIYSEKDVNAVLSAYHPDFARLRRELIDYGYLARNAHTGQYWVNPSRPARTGNHIQEAGVLEAFLC
ncbi:DUF2087 domain-containing protein [Brevibacterium marinum]|uniref:DUF2087 domain-containing protein n=1 Tax=Brevibacterium marinum TaxID=418643 RepID=A0A846S479_9MICO|nr:DUF2087 domain-containing protein [Brevibacterium marinum]NJC57813.1 hypothetical protein [Brevibacterium marinum]